ncbi:hypothetical protein Hanom_Chr15g01410591 [Helianthus anomalus]
MTTVEEVLIDRVNYLSMALEDFFREINLLHQGLNILVTPPMEPIWPQEDWNLANEVIQTRWDEIPPEPRVQICAIYFILSKFVKMSILSKVSKLSVCMFMSTDGHSIL